jgi:hypothetical protein
VFLTTYLSKLPHGHRE